MWAQVREAGEEDGSAWVWGRARRQVQLLHVHPPALVAHMNQMGPAVPLLRARVLQLHVSSTNSNNNSCCWWWLADWLLQVAAACRHRCWYYIGAAALCRHYVGPVQVVAAAGA